MAESTHSFLDTERGLLASKGYLVGYDIDGQSRSDQAVHPETGIIISVIDGEGEYPEMFHIWHPGINRSDAQTRYSLTNLLLQVGKIKKINAYWDWRRYNESQARLYKLRQLSQQEA
jgi:hypothetical protein